MTTTTTTTTTPAAPAAAAPAREAWLRAIKAPGVNVVDVQWTTSVKPAAAHKARVLTKITNAQALTGVEYAALAVNAGRETGALPWGEWADGLYPYVITHKGQDYARIYTVDGSLSTIYLVDGSPVAREAFLSYLTPAAAKAGRPNGGVLTIKIENVRVL